MGIEQHFKYKWLPSFNDFSANKPSRTDRFSRQLLTCLVQCDLMTLCLIELTYPLFLFKMCNNGFPYYILLLTVQ